MSWLLSSGWRGSRLLMRPLRSMSSSISLTEQKWSFSKIDVAKFVEMSGDLNPIHTHIVPGAMLVSVANGMLGSRLPRSMVVWQETKFLRTCNVDEELGFSIHVDSSNRKLSMCHYEAINGQREIVMMGKAKLIMRTQN